MKRCLDQRASVTHWKIGAGVFDFYASNILFPTFVEDLAVGW